MEDLLLLIPLELASMSMLEIKIFSYKIFLNIFDFLYIIVRN
jgi:hypothetical protein